MAGTKSRLEHLLSTTKGDGGRVTMSTTLTPKKEGNKENW